MSKKLEDLLTKGADRAELLKAIHSPSKHISLERLKQIKQDHHVGAGGKEYSEEEVHHAINERANTQAEKTVREHIRREKEMARQHSDPHGGALPPKFKIAKADDTKLVHYSRTPGLKQLDPNKMGTSGVGGMQYKRGVPENKSTFFYTHDSKPEDMVTQGAASKYTVNLQPHQKVYDLGTDPDHLVREMRSRNQGVWNEDMLHGVIKEKGYHGVKWKMHDDTHVVQMYHPVDIHSEENVNPHSNKLAASENSGYNSEMGELLTKGFVRNAALAGLLAMTPAHTTESAPPQPQATQQVQAAAPKMDAFKQKMLRTIAAVESTGGQNTNHAQVNHGLNRGHKAFGKYGLMPITIQEVLTKDPQFKAHFEAGKMDGPQLHAYMQKNPGLEDQVARSHLKRLRSKFGDDPAKIGYAWLNGVTGTNKAIKNGTPIKEHWHVKKILNAFNEKPQQAPAAPARQSLTQVKAGGN